MSKNTSVTFEQASGPIDYGFTNDYIFRAILQNHPKVLTGLVSALLHRPPGGNNFRGGDQPYRTGCGL